MTTTIEKVTISGFKVSNDLIKVIFVEDFIKYDGGKPSHSGYKTSIKTFLLNNDIEYLDTLHNEIVLNRSLKGYIGTEIEVIHKVKENGDTLSISYSLDGLADKVYEASEAVLMEKERYASLLAKARKINGDSSSRRI